MRRIVYNVAASLDGFIAGPNGEYDWIVMDPDIDFGAIFSRFDLVLMGRKTFEASQSMGGGMGDMETIVVSRTLDLPAKKKGISVVRDIEAELPQVKSSSGKDIWLFGGGALFRSLLGAGLVDRLEVSIVPVLLGGGIPLLPTPADRCRLALSSHRIYEKTGVVTLTYESAKSKSSA